MTEIFNNATNDVNLEAVAQELIAREKARARLIDFAQYMDPIYEPFAVHRLIASKLERIEAGALRRLALFVPPAIGKSRLSSEIFPAWFFGRNPKLEFIETSYNSDLAFSFGRATRNLIMDPKFQLVFPGVGIAADARSMDEWKTNQEGEYKAEGVGGGLIGFHAHVAIIDDPFKDYSTASSAAHCEAIWKWYTGVLLNRLRSYKNGNGAVILIMQRWTDTDLGGRVEQLVADDEEDWEIVSLPSIAEEDDALGRKPGEVLLPEGPNMRTVDELEALRAREPTMFMAVHQQKPISDQGELFKPEWFLRYRQGDEPTNLVMYGASDYALSPSGGDYTVHVIVGVDSEDHVWILDIWRAQRDIVDSIEAQVDLMDMYNPIKWFQERVMLNKAIGPVLKRRMLEKKVFCVLEDVGVIGKGSKDAPDRAGAFAGAMQLGYVHLPGDAHWCGEFEHELSRFPKGRHDDQVDAVSLIGMQLRSLMGARREDVPKDVFPLKPVGYTFDRIMENERRQRMGARPLRGKIVIPNELTTVLSEV